MECSNTRASAMRNIAEQTAHFLYAFMVGRPKTDERILWPLARWKTPSVVQQQKRHKVLQIVCIQFHPRVAYTSFSA
jgi:anthranilate/para-aminobenzoate synthase component II